MPLDAGVEPPLEAGTSPAVAQQGRTIWPFDDIVIFIA
jgi:hypothetical protein